MKDKILEDLEDFYNNIPERTKNDYEIKFYVGNSFLKHNKGHNQDCILTNLFDVK